MFWLDPYKTKIVFSYQAINYMTGAARLIRREQLFNKKIGHVDLFRIILLIIP